MNGSLIFKFFRLQCEILIHILSFLWPKDKSIILCSEWQGKRFVDNVAQLYSELYETDDYKFIWITKSKKLSKNFPGPGRPLYSHTLLSFIYHLRAKVFIVGSGKSDVIRSFVTSQSIVINTWHGPPLKNIYLLDVKERFKNHNYLSNIRKMRNMLYPFLDESPDYIVANNRTYVDIMNAAFKPKIGVLEGPLPRWNWPSDLSNNLTFLENYGSVVLYSPTFRDHDRSFFPLTSFELESLDVSLEEKNVGLLISVHPASSFELDSKYKHIHSLNELGIDNIYSQVLPLCNLVISDVSSLLHDSVAFDIPAIIFFPDYESYSLSSRGLLPGYTEILEASGYRGIEHILDNWLSKADSNTYVNDHAFFAVSKKNKVSFQIKEILGKLHG